MMRLILATCGIAATSAGSAHGQLAAPSISGESELASAAEIVDPAGEPNRLRAGIEVGMVLTFATVRYQFDGTRKENWDFPSIKQRFNLEAWRFDNNPFGINNLWHAVEGTFFHIAARSNNLGLPESFVVGFLSSFAWEFAFEFNEKVSINDVLFTPATGVAVGEFFHWLGRYLDSAPPQPSLGHSIARWTLGLPYAAHRRLDDTGAARLELDDKRDNLGLRADIWHRFSVAAGGGVVSGDIEQDSGLYSARASGRLVAIRGYRRPSAIATTFKNANITEMSYEATRGSGAVGYRFRAESLLAGALRQTIGPDGRGHGWLAAVSLAYDYRREQLGDWRDRAALLHLPGPALEGEVHWSGGHARLGVRAHGDFVSVEAPAHEAWKAANPELREKTILLKQGYYFGWGGSALVRGDLEITSPIPIELGASFLLGRYDSIENLDRSQEEVVADLDVDTTLVDLDAYVRLGLRADLPKLELRASHQMRESAQDGFKFDGSITRLSAGLSVQF